MTTAPAAPSLSILGCRDVCDRVGFDRSTLSRWIKDGTAVPFQRLTSGAYLFTIEEADRLTALFHGTG